VADNKPEPGAGDVPIIIDGKEHLMRPSLEACMAISKLAGGANRVIERCYALDFEMLVDVIAIGTGYTSGRERKLIAEGVYKQGTISVAADCVLFVRIVNNGGHPPADNGEVDEDADDPLSKSAPPSSTDA
jgi:hypothetical protein